jgi:uracil-DNA glycosylase family 4
MNSSQRVLNRSAGSLTATVMFIGEAPGRLGADDTGIPFHGDKAGHNFEELLEFAGIDRADIFVTNSVLCNPKDEIGNNSPPTVSETSNCSHFLKQQIDLVNPLIVVTLGLNALKATNLVEQHVLSLSQHVRTKNDWYNRILIPLYHPGQRAMLHRSYANQRSDYQFVSDTLKRLSKKTRKVYGITTPDVTSIVKFLFLFKVEFSHFALHKLLYLIEYHHVKKHGVRLTSAYFVRQKDGPYCTNLHPVKLKKAIPEISVNVKRGLLYIEQKNQLNLFQPADDIILLDESVRNLIEGVIFKYANLSNTDLKRVVYLSEPIKKMLRLEKKHLLNLYNAPIEF